MTRPGSHPIDPAVEAVAARLVQLHLDTHPRKIGKLLRLTPGYVRKLWARTPTGEMASLTEALSVIRPGVSRAGRHSGA